MSQLGGLLGEAFARKTLDAVKVGDYFVEHTVYKALKKTKGGFFAIKTAQNSFYSYGVATIRGTSKSATVFSQERKVTKTELIDLFANLSNNEIWSAVFYKKETDKKWSGELIAKIKGMQEDEAEKYVRENFEKFGKVERKLIGQKMLTTSDSNYYLVRDLEIYFDTLGKSTCVMTAEKGSIRKLDVNSLQSLIFNDVKYMLK